MRSPSLVKRFVLASIVLGGIQCQIARADFSSGMSAYNAHNYVEAIEQLKPEAIGGNKIAQNLVGVMYMNGLGVQQDDSEAMAWFRRSADQGYAVAQTNVGFLYERGRGIGQDASEAKHWYELAAAQGDPRAPIFLQAMNARAVQSAVIPSPSPYSQPTLPPSTAQPELVSNNTTPAVKSLTPSSAPTQNSVLDTLPLNQAANESKSREPYLPFTIMFIAASSVVVYFKSLASVGSKANKPACVSKAVNLFWLSLAIGLIRLIVSYSSMAVIAKNHVASIAVSLVLIFSFGFTIYLISQVSSGRNWARIVYLILFVIGLLFSFMGIWFSFIKSFSSGLISFVQLFLQAYSVHLLFTQDSSAWFRDEV